MQWAREAEKRGGYAYMPTSKYEFTGHADRYREKQSKQHQAFKRVLRDVAADTFVQERQTRDDEVRLHRDLAEELIDIGYRAFETYLKREQKDVNAPN
jgi:hypothetical protein